MISRRRVIAAAAGAAISGIVGTQEQASAVSSKTNTGKSKSKKSQVPVEAPVPDSLDSTVLDPINKQIVFYSPHPDDELLSFGLIASEYIAIGYEVVYVLLTSGSTTTAIKLINGELPSPGNGTRFVFKGKHDPLISGYKPLSIEDVGRARVNEFRSSVGEMLARATSVYCYDILVNNQIANEDAIAVMTEISKMYPQAIHWTMSTMDVHPHHRAAGEALRQLSLTTPIKTAFAISRTTWEQIKKQRLVNNLALPITFSFKPKSDRMQHVRNAVLPYNAWNPFAGSYAIGYSSVSAQFDDLETYANAQYCASTPALETVIEWITTSKI
jgi:LmbE family N-acetylglucosaminyl deacetylase